MLQPSLEHFFKAFLSKTFPVVKSLSKVLIVPCLRIDTLNLSILFFPFFNNLTVVILILHISLDYIIYLESYLSNFSLRSLPTLPTPIISLVSIYIYKITILYYCLEFQINRLKDIQSVSSVTSFFTTMFENLFLCSLIISV